MAGVPWWMLPYPGPEATLYLLIDLSVNLLAWTAVPCHHPSLLVPLHGLLSL